MRNHIQFFIDGRWVDPRHPGRTIDVIDPATEQVAGRIAAGSADDIDDAVKAARAAFPGFAAWPIEERATLLQRVIDVYQKRIDDIADAITAEIGAPKLLARKAQATAGRSQLKVALDVLKTYAFQHQRGTTLVVKEPIGVCGFITPWNWPINQIASKVAPALAVGCTMVLKPSEVAPFSAQVFAEVMAEAGVPKGVFNLVYGDGPTVGTAISAHPDIDSVSFTGSTRAGIEVARSAAPTVKRVHQELGGKSPNIVLPDADLQKAVGAGVARMMVNSGQSCNAPTRLLVPNARMTEALAIAKAVAEATTVGTPDSGAALGPVASGPHWEKVQSLIRKGIDEGATLVAGGPGRPDGLPVGFYVKPTVFGHVQNTMTIAREEIFGPVIVVIGYDTVDEAVAIANDSPYGLSGYVSGADLDAARRVAARLRVGQVVINGAPLDPYAPFGGFKQSGNGRECGAHAFDELLEVKALVGYDVAGG